MSHAITVKAPAKVNVTLEVVERLPSGYHNIRSVMVRLRRLADVVHVRVQRGAQGISIRTNATDIPVDEGNICHRAASRYLHHAGETAHVDINIDKAIPVAAGLGGGSSDAAAVLRALNRHFNGAISPRQLAALGSDIGKDIPFFLAEGTTCRVSGMGENVQVIPAMPWPYFLIVNPRVAVSTKEAYAALGSSLWFMERKDRADRSRAMASAIKGRDYAAVAAALYNDFEMVVERIHPIVKEIKHGLIALGANGASMSGSGPTVFGLFRSKKTLALAEEALKTHYPSFIVERG